MEEHFDMAVTHLSPLQIRHSSADPVSGVSRYTYKEIPHWLPSTVSLKVEFN